MLYEVITIAIAAAQIGGQYAHLFAVFRDGATRDLDVLFCENAHQLLVTIGFGRIF